MIGACERHAAVTLSELAALEAACNVAMERARPRVFDDAPDEVTTEQQTIHRAYAELAAGSVPDSDEALKRALFLQWYECAEPAFLTGIQELDGSASQLVMDLVEDRLTTPPPDAELVEMLVYYFSAAPWCLERFRMGPAARGECGRKPRLHALTTDVQRLTYGDRGLMGEYFLSLRR